MISWRQDNDDPLELDGACSGASTADEKYLVDTTQMQRFSAVQIFKISNRTVTSVFSSKRAQLFEIFGYLLNDADVSP